ncbi:hypothetical protein F4859DRAFT_509138 [Xylaria cf. heliscus]|nr:hypothetical protein F4859DRAFT_509138 [Xylaria cf. heliscus]
MKIAIVTLALVSSVVAQDGLGALPDCAKNCLAEFTTGNQIGDCARLDAKCICANDAFINGIACCLAGVCNADEQKQAVDYARSFCSTQGVTDLPQSVTCASASTSTSGSGTTTPTTAPASTTTTTPTPSATATPNGNSVYQEYFDPALAHGLPRGGMVTFQTTSGLFRRLSRQS